MLEQNYLEATVFLYLPCNRSKVVKKYDCVASFNSVL